MFETLSFITILTHRQGSSSSQISGNTWVKFEFAQNMSSCFVEWSFAAVMITTPRFLIGTVELHFFHFYFLCEVFILQTQIYIKNTNYKFKLICLQVACRKLKNIFSPGANPPTHNSHKNVLPTQTNTASKSCRFISVCNIFFILLQLQSFQQKLKRYVKDTS